MDRLISTNQDLRLFQQFPSCMTKPICNCFEEITSFNFPDGDSEFYISQSIDQIEYFIHLINIHQNKERIIEVRYTVKTTAYIFRRMVYFMNTTRRKFASTYESRKLCYVDFTTKCVPVLQYLKHIFLYYIYLDGMLEIMTFPDSKLNVSSLKELLLIHLELLFIFEQYLNLLTFGYTFSKQSLAGTNNHYQLFYVK